MKPVEAAHRASIRAHAEKHKKAGRATFSIPSILELLSSLEAAEAGVVEARAERDEWKQAVERSAPPGPVETFAELNYQRGRAELAEAVAGREENGRVLAEKRAEDAEARIAGLEAGLKRIADEDYEPIEESFTRAAAAIARALLAERDE